MNNSPEIPTSLLRLKRVNLTPKWLKLCQINTTQKTTVKKHSSKTKRRSSVLQKYLHNILLYNILAVIYRGNHHDANVYFQIGAYRIFDDSLMGTFFISLDTTQQNNSIFYHFS